MTSPETTEMYKTPFCRLAEVNYWRDCIDRLVMIDHAIVIPTSSVCRLQEQQDSGVRFGVLWKREGFDVLTGLAINGVHAGRLVAGEHTGNEIPAVTVHRALRSDGAEFSSELALEHLHDLEINSHYKLRLQNLLANSINCYPQALATVINWLGYPIDTRTFLKNIRINV